jgi:YggT family protein
VIGTIVAYVAYVLVLLIFARAILSWFPNIDTRNPLVDILYQVTEPFLAPIRSIMPRTVIDFSPMIASFILIFVAQIAAGSA